MDSDSLDFARPPGRRRVSQLIPRVNPTMAIAALDGSGIRSATSTPLMLRTSSDPCVSIGKIHSAEIGTVKVVPIKEPSTALLVPPAPENGNVPNPAIPPNVPPELKSMKPRHEKTDWVLGNTPPTKGSSPLKSASSRNEMFVKKLPCGPPGT